MELVNANVFDGQVIEDMQSAICDIPGASHSDNEWSGWFGSTFFSNEFADAVQRLEDICKATVLVWSR